MMQYGTQPYENINTMETDAYKEDSQNMPYKASGSDNVLSAVKPAIEEAIEGKNVDPSALSDGNPLKKEAEQAYDGDRRTDEVRDEAIEESSPNDIDDVLNQYLNTRDRWSEKAKAGYKVWKEMGENDGKPYSFYQHKWNDLQKRRKAIWDEWDRLGEELKDKVGVKLTHSFPLGSKNSVAKRDELFDDINKREKRLKKEWNSTSKDYFGGYGPSWDDDEIDWNMYDERSVLGNPLFSAIKEGDAEKVENIVEGSPEESKEALKEMGLDETPLMNEAEQLTDDGEANDEVSDEAVRDTLESIADGSVGMDEFDKYIEENIPDGVEDAKRIIEENGYGMDWFLNDSLFPSEQRGVEYAQALGLNPFDYKWETYEDGNVYPVPYVNEMQMTKTDEKVLKNMEEIGKLDEYVSNPYSMREYEENLEKGGAWNEMSPSSAYDVQNGKARMASDKVDEYKSLISDLESMVRAQGESIGSVNTSGSNSGSVAELHGKMNSLFGIKVEDGKKEFVLDENGKPTLRQGEDTGNNPYVEAYDMAKRAAFGSSMQYFKARRRADIARFAEMNGLDLSDSVLANDLVKFYNKGLDAAKVMHDRKAEIMGKVGSDPVTERVCDLLMFNDIVPSAGMVRLIANEMRNEPNRTKKERRAFRDMVGSLYSRLSSMDTDLSRDDGADEDVAEALGAVHPNMTEEMKEKVRDNSEWVKEKMGYEDDEDGYREYLSSRGLSDEEIRLALALKFGRSTDDIEWDKIRYGKVDEDNIDKDMDWDKYFEFLRKEGNGRDTSVDWDDYLKYRYDGLAENDDEVRKALEEFGDNLDKRDLNREKMERKGGELTEEEKGELAQGIESMLEPRIIEEEVEEDETIPKEEKEKVKKERKEIAEWLVHEVGLSYSGGGSVRNGGYSMRDPKERGAGGSRTPGSRALGSVGSHSGLSSVSPKGGSGHGSMPKHAGRDIKGRERSIDYKENSPHIGSKAMSFAGSGRGMLGRKEQANLSGGNFQSGGKGTSAVHGSKGIKSSVRPSSRPSIGKMGSIGGKGGYEQDSVYVTLREKIMAASKGWNTNEDGYKDSEDKLRNIRLLVKDESIYVVEGGGRRFLLENLLKKDPSVIKLISSQL